MANHKFPLPSVDASPAFLLKLIFLQTWSAFVWVEVHFQARLRFTAVASGLVTEEAALEAVPHLVDLGTPR